jgi:hypothetical protein
MLAIHCSCYYNIPPPSFNPGHIGRRPPRGTDGTPVRWSTLHDTSTHLKAGTGETDGVGARREAAGAGPRGVCGAQTTQERGQWHTHHVPVGEPADGRGRCEARGARDQSGWASGSRWPTGYARTYPVAHRAPARPGARGGGRGRGAGAAGAGPRRRAEGERVAGRGARRGPGRGDRRGSRGAGGGYGTRSVDMPNGLAVSVEPTASPLRGGRVTGCTNRSRTPRAARRRPNPARTGRSQARRRSRAGRPTSGRRRSARPGCSGRPACRYRPG